MKLICLTSLLASAAAFTTNGAAFTTQSYNVGQRVASEGPAHRTRKATIVMDGKANGTLMFLAFEDFTRYIESMHESISRRIKFKTRSEGMELMKGCFMTTDGSVCVELQKGRKVSRNSQTFGKGRSICFQNSCCFKDMEKFHCVEEDLMKKWIHAMDS